VRQSVFFNQSSAVFGADYTYINNKSKQLLTNSIEKKTIESHEVKGRLNFLKAWALTSSGMLSFKGNNSQLFATRNFYIKGYDSEHKLSYQPNTVFRISVLYKYSQKLDTIKSDIGTSQKAKLNTFGMELKYNQTEKGSLTGSINYINITYNSDANTSIAYEMLNGLNTGNNFTWELTYQRNLKNNIQISINYNGRKTTNASAVHLGGAQIRAFF
jgi:hypothetical protein